jgi:hypothetical protein
MTMTDTRRIELPPWLSIGSLPWTPPELTHYAVEKLGLSVAHAVSRLHLEHVASGSVLPSGVPRGIVKTCGSACHAA